MHEVSRKQTQSIKDKLIKDLESLPDKVPLFTPFDDEMIVRFYPTKGTAIAKLLNKTPSQLRHRSHELGVKKLR